MKIMFSFLNVSIHTKGTPSDVVGCDRLHSGGGPPRISRTQLLVWPSYVKGKRTAKSREVSRGALPDSQSKGFFKYTTLGLEVTLP